MSVTSPDLAYDRKLALIDQAVALARARPAEVVAVYGDEYTLHRQPALGPTWAGPGPEPLARLVADSDYTYRYGGALNAVTGQVIWDAALVFGVSKLRRLLRLIRRAYPTQALFLIWDNWPIHQHPDVLSRASELGIQILWLPTYAPWTNPIEKLWRWLIEEKLRHHRLAERWQQLKGEVATFLNQFSAGSTDLLRYVGLLPD